MALKKTRKLKDTNIDITDAYCRIKALRFDHPSRVWVEVGVYEDAESADTIDTVEYELTVEDFGSKGDIGAASAYELLKKKDEWKDAVDA